MKVVQGYTFIFPLTAAKKGLNHCPLCHENIDSGEDGWKDHLMGPHGCKQNPRRVMALEKNKGGNKGIPS
jgi:centrosomal protein CEP104